MYKRRIALSIVLGGLVTLAFAWARPLSSIAKRWLSPPPSSVITPYNPDHNWITVENRAGRPIGRVTPGWLEDSVVLGSEKGFWYDPHKPVISVEAIPYWTQPTPPGQTALPDETSVTTRASGLPWRCARMITVYHITQRPPTLHFERSSCWETTRPFGTALPTGPIWLGLSGDLAVWSVASLVVLSIPGKLRAAIRRRSGHCVKCGYSRQNDLGGPCPECGYADFRRF
jgi:hypothetical protein